MKLRTVPLSLLIISCLATSAFADDKKTYTNKQYNFTLDYPSSCSIKNFGEGYFDILQNDKIVLGGSVEDNTFKIFLRENKPERDVFRAFAQDRCKIVCGADGPDGSTYCDEIKSQREYVSGNDLRVMEFYLIMIREDDSENTVSESPVGPIYVVDISRPDHPLALMIHPGQGTLASEKTERLAQEVIDSVRLVE